MVKVQDLWELHLVGNKYNKSGSYRACLQMNMTKRERGEKEEDVEEEEKSVKTF